MQNLQLTQTAPPGNVMGSYGHIQSFSSTTNDAGVITATDVTVALYVSAAAKTAGNIPVGLWKYRLPTGTILADAQDSTGIILKYLLTTKSVGIWNSRQTPWYPGWAGATLVT